MDCWVKRLEAACANGVPIPGSSEDKILQAFRNEENLLQLCTQVLQATFPHSQPACFQAACVIREIVQKQWSTVPACEMLELRDGLTQFSVSRVAEMESYLGKTIACVIGCALKR